LLVTTNIPFNFILGAHRYADPEFIKIIRLQQLMSEYLLHIQNTLDSENKSLRTKNEELTRSLELLSEQFKKQVTIEAK
jgi:hypothetical protein